MSEIRPKQDAIPGHYRQTENLHILFWLMKDMGWCLGWHAWASLMILPTVAIAVVIAWRTRQLMAELTHNLAILCWIVANSTWMLSEFLGTDETTIFGAWTGKQLAVVPFSIGLAILGYYYLWYRPTHTHRHH